MNCEFCNSTFKSYSSLNNHKKSAKYCLKIQFGVNIENIKDFICNYCNKTLTSKHNLETHYKICKDKEIYILKDEKDKEIKNIIQQKDDEIKIIIQEKDNEIKNIIEQKDIENKNIIQQKDMEIQQKNSIIDKLEFIREKLHEQIKNQKEEENSYKKQINNLQDQIKEITLTAITKPTTMITNKPITNVMNNNKFNFISNIPSQEEITKIINSKLCDKYITNGMIGIAKFVYECIIKLEDGNILYACFDRARLMFKYKDENGNIVKDPKAITLRMMIKPGLVSRLGEMIEYLSQECEYLRKNKEVYGKNIDEKEYSMLLFLRDKATELGFEVSSLEKNNTFCNELSNLITV